MSTGTGQPVVAPQFKLPPWDGAVAQGPAPVAARYDRRKKATGAKNVVLPPNPVEKCKQWLNTWHPSLSTLYEFSNQRSRIGGMSFDTNTVIVDFGARYNAGPYTSLDLSYIYSHVNGWSPFGSTIENQHIGFLQAVQPINWFWNHNWEPGDLSCENKNHQLAIVLGGGYGGSPSSLSTPNSSVTHDTSHIFLGEALLDYQFSWFRCRQPNDMSPTRYYPSLLFEVSSGIEYDTAQPNSSTSVAGSTTARQLDYVNIATLTYSFPCRFGLQAGVEWDAPLSTDETVNSKRDRANTLTFTGGLVYNFYRCRSLDYSAAKSPAEKRVADKSVSDDTVPWWIRLRDQCSVSVLYSYTAFDPLTETNKVEIQFSYSF